MQNPLSLAILALAPHALAQVQGVVLDEQGQAIANASVEVVGTQLRTRTNDKGEFNLEKAQGKDVELHIEADNFAHGSFMSAQARKQNAMCSIPASLKP